jgi:hypothetical protein
MFFVLLNKNNYVRIYMKNGEIARAVQGESRTTSLLCGYAEPPPALGGSQGHCEARAENLKQKFGFSLAYSYLCSRLTYRNNRNICKWGHHVPWLAGILCVPIYVSETTSRKQLGDIPFYINLLKL